MSFQTNASKFFKDEIIVMTNMINAETNKSLFSHSIEEIERQRTSCLIELDYDRRERRWCLDPKNFVDLK